MQCKTILQGLSILMIIQACATQDVTNKGQKAYQAGNYEAALHTWDQMIEKHVSKGNMADSAIYFKAGMAASKLNQPNKAIRYLEKAQYLEYPSPQLYITLSKIAHDIHNLSKELEALENYHEKYPQGDKIDSMTLRLFETYVESENWKKAVAIWPEIKNQVRADNTLLIDYLTVNKNLDKDSICNKLANKILNLDPDNKPALEWYAKSYFWEAENLYVKEMKAYKNNRTTSQYDRLLNKLDEAYATFKKSRDYFLKLYEQDPDPRYAKYLGNIYTRLQKKSKARHYYDKAE
jgi:tetratricopeptide (TPR) repeat protein